MFAIFPQIDKRFFVPAPIQGYSPQHQLILVSNDMFRQKSISFTQDSEISQQSTSSESEYARDVITVFGGTINLNEDAHRDYSKYTLENKSAAILNRPFRPILLPTLPHMGFIPNPRELLQTPSHNLISETPNQPSNFQEPKKRKLEPQIDTNNFIQTNSPTPFVSPKVQTLSTPKDLSTKKKVGSSESTPKVQKKTSQNVDNAGSLSFPEIPTSEIQKKIAVYTPIVTVRWMKHYQELLTFKIKYGHCNASRKNQQWKSLGHWVRQQRRKKKQSKLTEHQIELLDSLGFEWDRSYYLYAKVPHKDKLPHPPSTYLKYHQALNSPSINYPLSLAAIAALENQNSEISPQEPQCKPKRSLPKRSTKRKRREESSESEEEALSSDYSDG